MSQTAASPTMATVNERPSPIHVSRSFTRMDNATPSPISPTRKRASTLHEAGIPAVPEARHIDSSPDLSGKKAMLDVFENNDEEEHAGEQEQDTKPELNVPSTFDELPIEIRSLCDRFLESLSAKVHPTPWTADQLSAHFQDFYERAATHVHTHIANLASRIGRSTPPASSASSSSRKQIGRSRAGSGATKSSSDDLAGHAEMLTASEVADRKKARRLLEHKRVALEEAVERGVCERVYDKIWQHRSTDDEARDEKLRSRTAALSVVGIGLKELHMDSDPAKEGIRRTAEEKEDDINQSLAAARESLRLMDENHYPLGKLQHLTAAHKSIVETLSDLFPSSSSADEILPTLIYTLITCPQTGVNAVSNLNFIQRFRTSSKVDGEAAYCLVNLEAAISFLETVDLSSLRADELPEGPAKSNSRPSTPATENPSTTPRPAAARTLTPGLSPVTAAANDQSTPANSAKAASLPSPTTPNADKRPEMHQRRISGLIQAQVDRVEAGRENFLNAADKVYDSINGTLDNSLQFLFGRFKEQASGDSPLPKTLEEARKLVSSPMQGDDDESLSISGRSSPGADDPLSGGVKSENKMLELLGGKKQLRDHSVDSTRSGGSGRRVTFDGQTASVKARKDDPPTTPQGNLFNTINSMNPLGKFNMPKFPFGGKATSNMQQQPALPVATDKPASGAAARLSDIVESPANMKSNADQEIMAALERTRSRDDESTNDDLNARETLAELRKVKPPKRRFLEVKNVNDLRLGEVEELLLEYRRLAKAIGEAVAQ